MYGWTVERKRWMNRWVDERVSRYREERRDGGGKDSKWRDI